MRVDLHYTLTPASRFNIAPSQSAPVCRTHESVRTIDALRWGLLPRWRGHGGKRGPLVNAAPIEAIAGTPLLRDSFKKQRCLVLADGCFAWRDLRQPICYHPEPRRIVAFAGVWNISEDDDVASFALILGPPMCTQVSHPMPVVLAESDYDAWLDPAVSAEDAIELLVSTPLANWRADPVSTRMAQAQFDDERCIAPVGNPNQGELF
jgi:putative SOS response-associated peptidase YedK